MRLQAEAFDGEEKFLKVDDFFIEDRATNYTLHAGTFTSGYYTGYSDWNYGNNQQFSKEDRDNDIHQSFHCAGYQKAC